MNLVMFTHKIIQSCRTVLTFSYNIQRVACEMPKVHISSREWSTTYLDLQCICNMYSQTPFKSNILRSILHKLHLVQWTWIHLLIYTLILLLDSSHTRLRRTFLGKIGRPLVILTTMCTTTICFNAFLEQSYIIQFVLRKLRSKLCRLDLPQLAVVYSISSC